MKTATIQAYRTLDEKRNVLGMGVNLCIDGELVHPSSCAARELPLEEQAKFLARIARSQEGVEEVNVEGVLGPNNQVTSVAEKPTDTELSYLERGVNH